MDLTAKWSRLSKQTLQSCPYHDFCHDEYRLPDGSVGDYYYIEIPGSSMVVPVLESGELVLVRQHRYLHGRSSLELPAGGIKRGRDPLSTAPVANHFEAGIGLGVLLGVGPPLPDLSPDRDHDGLLNAVDRCPDQAEDPDGFEDADGCPDPDNDHDAVPDELDLCPNRAGPAPRGCP